MRIEEDIEDIIRERKKIGIWGNESCAQCGACCYEYNL
jgi:hypothetical protein